MNSTPWFAVDLWVFFTLGLIYIEHTWITTQSWCEIHKYYKTRRREAAKAGRPIEYEMWCHAEQMYMESRGETSEI